MNVPLREVHRYICVAKLFETTVVYMTCLSQDYCDFKVSSQKNE